MSGDSILQETRPQSWSQKLGLILPARWSLTVFPLCNFFLWFVQNAGGATQDKAHDMAGAAKVRFYVYRHINFCRF